MNSFIDSLELDELIPMAGDMSPRKYARGVKGDASTIIMRYPDINDESRKELQTFIRITEFLAAQGVKVPALLALDEESLTAQFEDLGAQSFGDLMRSGTGMTPYYELAVDVLKHLKSVAVPDDFAHYHNIHIHDKRRQLVEYYYPLVSGKTATSAQMADYLSAWEEIEKSIPLCPQGFLHVDYHLENLMWCPGEQGIKRCGLIDYQDAVTGPLPYDLLNLLEDARVDVDPALKSSLIDRYCDDFSADEKQAFLCWYDLLSAQFHSRVTGLFIMQAAENNRDDYLPHIPRLQSYLRAALEKPVLAPYKHWCEQVGLDFAPINDLNGETIRERFSNLKG